MNKPTAIILTLALVACISSCEKNDDKASEAESDTTETAEATESESTEDSETETVTLPTDRF